MELESSLEFLENILGIFEARVCSHLIPWNLNKNLSMFKWLNEYVWKGIKFLDVGINFGNFWSMLGLFELKFELMEDVFNEVVMYECFLRVVKDIRILVYDGLVMERKIWKLNF